MSLLDWKPRDYGDSITFEDIGFSMSTVAGQAFDQYNLTTGIQREGEKGIYNIIARFKGTDLNNEEIKAYVGERNSNLKTDGLESISKKALDLMIEDKREEEKLILYSQYRKKGLLSDVTYYGASFIGQMIDPIALATGVGIEAVAAKTSVTMRTMALNIAKASTRAGKIKAGAKLGIVYGTAEALLTEPLFYYMAQLRQENYSVDDSVLNIAFGTIAGGVFGAAGSAFSRVKPPKLETIKPEVEARIIKTAHNQAVSERKVNIDPIVELDPKYHYANKVEKSRNVEELTPKDKEVKLKTLKDADLLRPMTINPEIRIMEDIIDELKAKHTEPSGVKLERLEKKFEPVEKILREGRLPEYNELPGILKRQINNREFLKRDPEAQNIVNTLDDRPDEFKTTPPMKEVEVETVEKTELGTEDIPFLRELSDATDNPLDELGDGEFDELMSLIKGCRL
jgi:hypothetical protein